MMNESEEELPCKYRFHQVIEMVGRWIPKVQVENKMLISNVRHRIMTQYYVDFV